MFFKSGIDPRTIETMSLYELISMSAELEKLDNTHKPKVSDEEWREAEAMLAAVTDNDPSVVLH